MGKPRKKMRREKPEFEQKLLDLRRVTRVVKGGRRFRFRATVVAGNRRGKVGVGVSKGSDVTDAISKAYAAATKSMIEVPLRDGTIPHDIAMKLGSAKVILKPAKEGRGLIAGGAVRTIVDLAGISDITSKSLGTSNKLNVARVTLLALASLQEITPSSKKVSQEKPMTSGESIQKEEKKDVEKKEVRKTIKKTTTKPVAKKGSKEEKKKEVVKKKTTTTKVNKSKKSA